MSGLRPLPVIPPLKTHFWDLKLKTKAKEELGRREGYMFLALTVVLMVAATDLISSSTDILNAKQCEIKTALDYIYLEYTPYHCKHHNIQEMAGRLMALGIVELIWNFIFFLVIVRMCLWQSHFQKLGFTVLYVVLGIVAVILFITTLAMFIVVRNKKEDQTDIDFVHLQATMIVWLHKHYTSDSLSSSDKISTGWNNFFLQYDCCAIREVLGTNNDFDNTPWCTSSGSCQATASQIPKTCCKSVTKDDYQSAPSECYASLNHGTFKENCIGRLKTLSDENIDASQLSKLFSSLLALVILQLLEATVVLLLFVLICKRSRMCSPELSMRLKKNSK